MNKNMLFVGFLIFLIGLLGIGAFVHIQQRQLELKERELQQQKELKIIEQENEAKLQREAQEAEDKRLACELDRENNRSSTVYIPSVNCHGL